MHRTTGEIPKEELLIYGYKEPLAKFTGGFGYAGVLSCTKDLQKVQCHFCGELFKSLSRRHLSLHKLNAKEYKIKVGLSQKTALCGEATRQKYMKRLGNPNYLQDLKKAQKARRKQIDEGGGRTFKKKSLQDKNKQGNCPDQLLDKISKTIKSFGRVPTIMEFKKFHEGRFLSSIQLTYGTWSNALKLLGKKSHNVYYSKEDLLQAMRVFYKTHNRSPRLSDMQRGLIQSPKTFYKHWSSLNDARKEAGVPYLIKTGRNWVESIKKYE